MNTRPLTIAALFLAACTAHTDAPAAPPSSGPGRTAPAEEHGSPAAKPAERSSQPELKTSFDYYDGTEKRTLWLAADLIAEFAPSDAGREALLRADPRAQEVPQSQAGVRIWRLSTAHGVEAFVRDASTPSMRLSPVLHQGPTAGLPLRALPGGVVTTFPPGWDRARIEAWLAARKLQLESEVVAGANMYLVATPAGLDALRIANELHATGELVGATPNFWLQMSAR